MAEVAGPNALQMQARDKTECEGTRHTEGNRQHREDPLASQPNYHICHPYHIAERFLWKIGRPLELMRSEQ